MPTGVRLDQLVSDLREELSQSTTLAHGAHTQSMLEYLLQRTQRRLALEVEWPFLKDYEPVALSANVEEYSYPSGVTFNDVLRVWVHRGAEWVTLDHGITLEDRASGYFDGTPQSGQPEKWGHKASTGKLIVWPVPSAAETAVLEVQQPLAAFVDPGDTCTLDSDLIVLRAAATYMTDRGLPGAQHRRNEANVVMQQLLRRQRSVKRDVWMLSGGPPRRGWREGIDYVSE